MSTLRLRKVFFWAILFLPMLKALQKAFQHYSSAEPNSWFVTEWLINYSAGFVRRGLGGSILIGLSNAIRTPLVMEVALVLAISVIVLVSLIVFGACRKLSAFDALMISFCPASYPLFLAYHVDNVFRKDALVVLFVIACAYLLPIPGVGRKLYLLSMAVLVLPVITLIHEMAPFFCLPPLMLLIYIDNLGARQTFSLKSMGMTLVLTMPTIACLLILRNFGYPSGDQVMEMCLAWQGIYPDLTCMPIEEAGAFSLLADYTVSQEILNWIHGEGGIGELRIQAILSLIFILSLSMGPLGRLVSRQTNQNYATGSIVAVLTTAFVFIFSLPLYWLATDFGRWMATSLTVVIVLLANKNLVSSIVRILDCLSMKDNFWSAYPWASLYSNLNGIVLAFNLFLTPVICCVAFWQYSPLLRILFKPYGL